MQLFAIKLVSFKNKCIFKIVIFSVLLATSWFVITTVPVLLSLLLLKVPRSINVLINATNTSDLSGQVFEIHVDHKVLLSNSFYTFG